MKYSPAQKHELITFVLRKAAILLEYVFSELELESYIKSDVKFIDGSIYQIIFRKKISEFQHYGKDKPYPGKEDNLQKATARWLAVQHPTLPAFHVPNGGKRPVRTKNTGYTYSPEAVKLKAMGTKPGVSDWLILQPSGPWHGACIELKAEGGQLQQTQNDFLETAAANGYFTAVVWNFEGFQAAVKEFLGK